MLMDWVTFGEIVDKGGLYHFYFRFLGQILDRAIPVWPFGKDITLKVDATDRTKMSRRRDRTRMAYLLTSTG
jgi:hypothetical protein